MAVAAPYAVTTIAGVNKIWRTVQTGLQTGAQFLCEEWQNLADLTEFEVDWSARSITVPLDIYDETGIASIPEGGYEARPQSTNADQLSLSWILLHGRFSISKTAKWIDQRNRAAMIERQIRFQAMKKLQALGKRFGEYFYGVSNGIVAQTTTAATQSSGAYVLANAYGVTGLTGAAGFSQFGITNFFAVGDYVALIRTGALVANAIGVITAITPGTPSITVTWNGSVTSQSGDGIVFANSVENTTIAGTDYGNALVGMIDGMTSASVHGLATATAARWTPGYSNTAGGRFNGIRLRKMKQGIYNSGGGELDVVWWSNGVENDTLAGQQGALRFNDPFGMELDGSTKSKGVKFNTTRKVPTGYTFGYSRKSVRRMTLLPKPTDGPAWEDGYKLQDQSGYVFAMDYPCAMVWLNRGNTAYLSGLTEQ